MLRTSIAVLAFGLVGVLLVAGVGGAVADDPSYDADEDRTASVETTQQFGEVELIVEDRSGERLRNIEVTAAWDGGEETTQTSSAGRALIDVPAETPIEVTVNDPNNEYVKNLQPVELTDAVGKQTTITMAERGELSMTVLDTSEEPVEDVRVRLLHEGGNRIVDTVYTDENGEVSVPDIEQRSYDISTRRAGYLSTEHTVELDSDLASQMFEVESARVNVDFTVFDDADHFESPQPLEGATIDIENFGTLPGTFSDGTQDQSLPVNDDYEVTVTKEGYQERTTTLDVGEEPTSLELNTQRTPSISIQQLQNQIVVGQPTQVTITDAYDLPVEGASVSLNGESVGQTDAQGQIVFNITAAGDNEVTAESQGRTASMAIRGVETRDETADDTDDEQADDTDDADDADDADDTAATDDDDDDGDDDEGDDALGPGFGVLAAIGALIGIALLARRR